MEILMNIVTIFEWIGYIIIGSLVAFILVVLPIVLLLDRGERKHSAERRFEQENIGYREEPIE